MLLQLAARSAQNATFRTEPMTRLGDDDNLSQLLSRIQGNRPGMTRSVR